jgi:uncharacterized protein (DUF427 family)
MSRQTPIPAPMTGANPAPGFGKFPDHVITITPFSGTVTVTWNDTLIARSPNAVKVDETNHATVFYLPVEDVDASLLRRSAHASRCPFKGDASYWDIVIGDHEIDNAMWGYETPYDEMLELAGLVAFYASKVTVTADRE